MKKKNHSKFLPAFILLIFISHLVSIPSFLPSVNAQGAEDAYFTGVGHTLKVYEYTQDNWNFTVYNVNCEVDIWGHAWFFFRFYLDNVLWWDEQVSSSTWQLNKGQSTTRFYTVNMGSGPAMKSVKIELYWDNDGTPYLQDTTYFSEWVVKLFVDAWSPSPFAPVEKGKLAVSTLSVSLKNGGNDYMYSVSVSVIDSAGLTISPDAQNLQDIASQGTKSTSFSVTAPLTATLGTKTVYFEVSYSDFREVAHTETKTASVTVTKLSTSISLTLQPSSLKKGASTTITATLRDGNNIALANKEISFSIETTSLGTATTDSSGNAIKTYTANLDAETYSVQASYAGSTDYAASSSTGNLIVIPSDTTQTINAPSVKAGTAATITTTLKDEQGEPISDATIDFYIFENNAWSKVGSATTNAVGQASFAKTFDEAGDYQIKTVYAGSINYNKINATATLTISPSSSGFLGFDNIADYAPYYIIGGILIAGAIFAVGFLIYRRRKKPA